MSFVGNFVLFAAVKEFCKSIKKWQSYSHGYGGTLFWPMVCFRSTTGIPSAAQTYAPGLVESVY